MRFKKRNAIVGIDVGTREIKAVELTDFGDAVRITGYGSRRLDPNEDRSAAIADLLATSGIKSKRVVTAVSGRSVIVRYITLPYMSEDELRGALRYEADKYIPFEIDEVMIDGQQLGGSEAEADDNEDMRVLLCAAKKDLIQEHVQLLQDSGLTSVAIDVDCFALSNAFELSKMNSPHVEDEDAVIALVDVGASKTNINIVRGNTSYFSREIYLGGNELTDAVARTLHLDEYEAEDLKCDPMDREAEVRDATQVTLDDLANEIQLSFDYFENQFDNEVSSVMVSGGAVESVGLRDTFERIFERPVMTWDPTENLELKGDRIDVEDLKLKASQLPIAIGLGARILNVN